MVCYCFLLLRVEGDTSAGEERLVHEAADGRHGQATVLDLLQLVLLADVRGLGGKPERVESEVSRLVPILVHVVHGHLAL